MSISKVDRPIISDNESTAHILEDLLHKNSGDSWVQAAKKVGIKYQTLKEWYDKNLEAKNYYKEHTKLRNERIQDNLDNAYEILIDDAPAISKEFIKLIKSDKIRP